MRRRDFIRRASGFATGAWLLPTMARAQAAAPDQVVTELKQLIPRLMQTANLPGLAIAVIHGGKRIWQQGFGVKDRETKQAVDADTIFEAASVSKTVFAYAVMKLCDDGIIGLDTPLTQYASDPFLTGDSRLERITARHVLSHTSGFQNWRSVTEPLKIHFPPGEKFLYSGEGYFYLQSVVSHLRGRVDRQRCAKFEGDLEVCATDIDETLRQSVLQPFGMSSSGYLWRDALAKHVARAHDEQGRPLNKPKSTATDAARYASAGGLYTTAADYAKFLLEVVDPKPADAHRLNRTTWKEMLRPHIKLPPDVKIDGATAWALGWAIQERPNGNLIIHSGGQTGFRSLAIGSVERKAGFVIFTNGDSGGNVIYDEKLIGLLGGMLTQ